jgi:thioredoxin reductase (NADPH)
LPALLAQIEFGTIGFLPETIPVEIRPGLVVLQHVLTNERLEHPTDFVLLLTGFVADQTLFEQTGVHLLGEHRTPEFNPETMETNVPGLYVAGTAAAGSQRRYVLFIENSHVHVGRIFKHLTGRWPAQLGTIAERSYEPPLEDIQAN